MSSVGKRAFKVALGQPVVLAAGTRTPFLLSGTGYGNLLAHDLGRMAIKGLLVKTAVDPATLDGVVYGTVIQEARTSNIARESALGAGVPDTTPAHTVTLACISANVAISHGAALIGTGQASAVVVGGTETMSDVPIRFSREMRKRMLAAQKGIRGIGDVIKFLRGFKLSYLIPEAPAIAEFSTGEVMGHSSDRLAAKWGVSRTEQDDFAFRSHTLAAAAIKAGNFHDEITPGPGGNVVDNGVRGDTPRSKYDTLKPAFIKPHGTHTAANSSFLTDGASAALLMSEARAIADNVKPKAYLRDWIFVSQDPREELLLGPAYAIARLLARNGLTMRDISVVEMHEAFAGQVLSNFRALESESFVRDKVGLGAGAAAVGTVPFEKLNLWGGSLSIGHPFGATGTRLLATAANRLIAEDGRLAIIAACAAGGQGHAMLIERHALGEWRSGGPVTAADAPRR